jgi:hypothetical protein
MTERGLETTDMAIQLCFPCGAFVGHDGDGPTCEHTEDEATETDLDNEGIARTKLEAVAAELQRPDPRVSETMLQAEMMSLAAKVPAVEPDIDGHLTAEDIFDALD